MRTQELIHPATPTRTLWSPAPGLLAPRTTQQIIDEVAACSFAERKTDPCGDRSIRLRPVRQRCVGRLTLSQRAPHRWGVVLAGGDGVRLQQLTQWMYGEDRPKQFCQLLRNRTLLEEARQRAERSFPKEQILFSLTRAHENHYLRYLADRPSQRIVQPLNKGTAPAILSTLTRIAQADPDAVVSILPCDHYYSSESAFTVVLESALEIAERRTGSVILLGAEPNQAETEYGWIEVGQTMDGHSGLFRVEGFKEKPPLALAQALLRKNCLWNTFVMVGHVGAFLEMARMTAPGLLKMLESMQVKSDGGGEIRIPHSVYCQIAPMDFSRHILPMATERLLALRLKNIEWNDLGDPYRVLVTLLENNGDLPEWVRLWPATSALPQVAAAAA
jgi:mannose-1-phosphate guanylyltransferase